MARRSKKDKGPSALRAHLATTVRILRDRKYRALPNVTARDTQLAKDADVSRSQIQRIIQGQLGASVDIIEALAAALEIRPQDLLTPYFASAPEERAAPSRQPSRQMDELQRRRGA